MDIGLLKTFLEIHRTRHFGQAADNLFLTQSAVSARIRLLEQTVGVQLFTRTRNNIELTPAGKKLLKYAETILTTWNRARQDISVIDSDHIPLAVGGVPSLWDILLQSWLNNLIANNANIAVHAEVNSAEVLVRRMLDNTLDLAFLFESLQMTELVVEEVATIVLILVTTTPGLNAREAVDRDYVLVDWGTSFSLSHAQHFQDMSPPRVHVQLGRLAHHYILEHGGSAYLAQSMVADDLEKGVLHVVEDAPSIKRKVYAAYSPQTERREIIEHALAPLLKV